MHVTVEDISPVEKKVAVKIDWPMVAARLDEAYRELGRGVTLKGFRKGKVPRSILEKIYARQVEGEVRQRLVQESFMQAAQKHEIAPVVEPVVDDLKMEPGQGFAYSARVEVRAPFTAEGYFDVELEREKPAVSDEEVEEALKAKQRELTEFKKIDGRTELAVGDVAFIDVSGQLGSQPIDRKGVMVDVGSDEAGEAIPGIGKALAGVGLDAKDHELTFTVPKTEPVPEGLPQPPAELRDLEGQSVTVKVTVREAREKSMPAIDDDFARDTGEADTLAELKEKLRVKVGEQKERSQEGELRSSLIKKILEKNQFQVAPALVERQIEVLIRRAQMQLAMRGIDPKTVPMDVERLRTEMRPTAVEEVRGLFLLDAVATQEKLEVTEADLEKKLAELARERGKNTARLKAELQKEGRLDSIRYQLREEKTLDLLMSRAKISVK